MLTNLVTYSSSSGTAQGHLALPSSGSPWGAIVVIQEWWGLDQHIVSIANRLATAGFVALAPDLYHGAQANEPDEARKLAMALEMPQAVDELVAATNYLCGRPDVRAIGTVGFCLGGSLALALASSTPRVGPVASFYGGRQVPDDQLRQIKGPVLLLYGEADQGIPPATRQHVASVLQQQGISHELVVYPDAGHAFMNDSRPHGFNPVVAADAWQRLISFMRAHLENP